MVTAVMAGFLLACLWPASAGAAATPDPTFSGDGVVALDLVPATNEYIDDVAVDSQGRILVAGTAYPEAGGNFGFAARLTADGQPDETFSDDGFASLAGSMSVANGVAIDGQDRISLSGYSYGGPASSFDFQAGRLLPNGLPDPAFSGDGFVTINVAGGSWDTPNDVALDSQGRLLLAGTSDASGPTRPTVVRLDQSGAPDPGFGTDGIAIANPASNVTGTRNISLDSQGRILLAVGMPVGMGGLAPGVMRLTPSGDLDLAFNPDAMAKGLNMIGFGYSTYESPTGLAVDADDRPVLGALLGNNLPYRSGFARFTDAGTPDPGFGAGGLLMPAQPESNLGLDIAIDPAGRIISGGSFTPEGGTQRASILRIDDGQIDTEFGNGGFLPADLLGNSSIADVVTVDPQGRYLVAGRAYFGTEVRMGFARFDVDYPSPPPPPQTGNPKCRGQRVTVAGTARADRLKGTRKRDVIAGFGGNDVIKGLGGNDVICGGAGNDTLVGGPGNDTLQGDAGRDVLKGGPGRDRLIGGKGRDRCLKGPGKGRFSGCERRR